MARTEYRDGLVYRSDVDEDARLERPRAERILVPCERDFVLRTAVDVVEHSARQAPTSLGAEIVDVQEHDHSWCHLARRVAKTAAHADAAEVAASL